MFTGSRLVILRRIFKKAQKNKYFREEIEANNKVGCGLHHSIAKKNNFHDVWEIWSFRRIRTKPITLGSVRKCKVRVTAAISENEPKSQRFERICWKKEQQREKVSWTLDRSAKSVDI